MGYIRHHAIVVTGSDYCDVIDQAHQKAEEIARKYKGVFIVSPMLGPAVNGYKSFMVAPDGSKEGWEASNRGDLAREALIEWMDKQRYVDGSGPLDWVEVQYGDDDLVTRIVSHSDEGFRSKSGNLDMAADKPAAEAKAEPVVRRPPLMID